ncbi:MAG: hypothetical protein ACR2QC_11920 [Gammaproteobacteria bacterium]
MTSSEALYGFVGWLTSRETPVIASKIHDAAIWAEMVDDFCMANELPEPRDGWEKSLVFPIRERRSRDVEFQILAKESGVESEQIPEIHAEPGKNLKKIM